MDKKEQRIALAKAEGWTKLRYIGSHLFGKPSNHKPVSVDDKIRLVPDYLNCLNAMHNFEEKVFVGSESAIFATYLLFVCSAKYEYPFPAIHASAEQRAKAALLTLRIIKPEF